MSDDLIRSLYKATGDAINKDILNRRDVEKRDKRLVELINEATLSRVSLGMARGIRSLEEAIKETLKIFKIQKGSFDQKNDEINSLKKEKAQLKYTLDNISVICVNAGITKVLKVKDTVRALGGAYKGLVALTIKNEEIFKQREAEAKSYRDLYNNYKSIIENTLNETGLRDKEEKPEHKIMQLDQIKNGCLDELDILKTKMSKLNGKKLKLMDLMKAYMDKEDYIVAMDVYDKWKDGKNKNKKPKKKKDKLGADWLNCSPRPGFRRKLTINKKDLLKDSDAVYINLKEIDEKFFSNIKSDGSDIKITKADGKTQIARDVAFINVNKKDGGIYFAPDKLKLNKNSYFYLYYGEEK